MVLLGRIKPYWKRMTGWWHRLSHFKRNCVIGVAIEVVIIVLESVHWAPVAWLENYALDMMMRGAAGQYMVEQGKAANARPLVFVDIDERTWRSARWSGGEPLQSPRAELYQLIAFAAQAGAQHVVLDVLVEGKRDDPDDRDFAQSLESLVAQTPSETTLVLVRSVRLPPDAGQVVASSPVTIPEQRTSAVDDVLGRVAGRVAIAAPYFIESSDGRVRDWELWEVVCREAADSPNRNAVVLPSVQLVVATAHLQLDVQAAAPWLHPPTESCPVDETSSRAVSDKLNEQVTAWLNLAFGLSMPAHQLVAPDAGGLANRIVYRTADVTRQGGVLGESAARRLVRVSALDVLEKPDETRRRIAGYVKGAIVVIGVSRTESYDLRRTPIGEMPGALVMLNSIDSMLRFGLLRSPSLWIMIPLMGMLIVLVAFVYARWDSVVGTLIATIGGVFVFWVLSYWFFKYGIWLNFALPVIGIQIHRIVKSREEKQSAVRRVGRR